MVKLASVRGTRQYGPGGSRDVWEDINAFGYLVAVFLLTVGSVMLLPHIGYSGTIGLWFILVGLVFILIVNVHDLYAQAAGFDFKLPLVTLDPQLALIEIATPLLQAVGAIIYWVATFLLLRVARGDYSEDVNGQVWSHANNILIAGAALWLLGSILNSFQVYENTELVVQAYQRGVTLPFVIGSVLLVLSGIVTVLFWPVINVPKAKTLATSLAVAGFSLYLVGALVNIVRIMKLQSVEHQGGHVEQLRGGAQEALLEQRDEEEAYAPLSNNKTEDDPSEIESGLNDNPYKSTVVAAAQH